MRIRPRFLIGGGLIVAAIAYLITTAVRNAAEYYLTVPEAVARQSELGGQRVRVAGRVSPGSVSWDPAALTLSFAIAPIPEGDRAGVQPAAASAQQLVQVVCKGQPKPDMFAENRDVIVEGRIVGANAIAADQVLTSCPSKYAAKAPH
jgi:cytochrome c-type biogenesis protein CcmE